MKTKFHIYSLITTMILLPQLLAAQWNMVRFDEYNYFTKAFAASPQTVFVGGTNMTGPGSFIMRTNDGGTTWDSINFSPSLVTSSLYDISFTDVNHGFAGGINNNNQVLLATTDNGTTWNAITPNPSSVLPINSISFVNQLEGFVSSESEVYQTADGGANWTTYTSPILINTINFIDMMNGFAGGTTGTLATIIKTTDGGQTWSNQLLTVNQNLFVNSMGKLDVLNSNVIFSSLQYSNKIFKSIDGGLNWDTITVAQINSIQDYDFSSPSEGHVLSTMGEIYGTIDGGLTWNLEYAVAGGLYGPSVFLTSVSFSGTTGYVCGSNGLIKKYTVGTTGINEDNNLSEQAVIFPNPVICGNEVSIAGIEGVDIIEIFNNLGQRVYIHKLNADISNSVQAIKVSLSRGIYSVVVTKNQKLETQKLVVW